MRFRQLWAIGLVVLSLWAISSSGSGWAAPSEGARLFEVHCVGCHANGGNIIRRGKNLKLKALEKNGMNTLPAIANLVANGKANMSAYKDRLTTAEIAAVSAFVLEQAQHHWQP